MACAAFTKTVTRFTILVKQIFWRTAQRHLHNPFSGEVRSGPKQRTRGQSARYMSAHHEPLEITKVTILIHKVFLRLYLGSADERVTRRTRVISATSNQTTAFGAWQCAQRKPGAFV